MSMRQVAGFIAASILGLIVFANVAQAQDSLPVNVEEQRAKALTYRAQYPLQTLTSLQLRLDGFNIA